MINKYKEILKYLKDFSSTAITNSNLTDNHLYISLDSNSLVSVIKELKNGKYKFSQFLDIAGIDRLNLKSSNRFEVVYLLRSIIEKADIHIAVSVVNEELDSITTIYKGADWAEREVFDQYGIKFIGHPNLKRILNHKDFIGNPLRKDYPIKRRHILESTDNLMDELHPKMEALKEQGVSSEDLMIVNLGPAHPAMHGCLRVLAALDGETIATGVSEIGYLHRGFEKSVEGITYTKVIPYTDRLNYCSSAMNNIAYCRTVESMLGIEIPDRAVKIRVIFSELSRIIDHLVCLGANLVDIGGLTNFWYLFNPRESVYKIFEKYCGARLTVNLSRIGGQSWDLYSGFADDLEQVLKEIEKGAGEARLLNEKNRIFIDRTSGVCPVSAEDALDWGYTGPSLRASGVEWDLRKDKPYYGYDELDFNIPVGSSGDTYDRLMVRFIEIEESIKIIRQVQKQLSPGATMVDDPRIVSPNKKDVYGNIEGLMNQFKLTIDGINVPAGEAYMPFEAANGELGFYIVSDGSGKPYRIKVRPPCFYLFNSFEKIIEGSLVADAVSALGSLNIIAGELDR